MGNSGIKATLKSLYSLECYLISVPISFIVLNFSPQPLYWLMVILAPYKLSFYLIPSSLYQFNFHIKIKFLIPIHKWNNFYITYSNHTLKYSIGTPSTVLVLYGFITLQSLVDREGCGLVLNKTIPTSYSASFRFCKKAKLGITEIR